MVAEALSGGSEPPSPCAFFSLALRHWRAGRPRPEEGLPIVVHHAALNSRRMSTDGVSRLRKIVSRQGLRQAGSSICMANHPQTGREASCTGQGSGAVANPRNTEPRSHRQCWRPSAWLSGVLSRHAKKKKKKNGCSRSLTPHLAVKNVMDSPCRAGLVR